jgi:hypothetical protein
VSLRIASTSTEPVEVLITTDVDPTATNDVSFQLLATGSEPPASGGGAWTAGTWQTPVATGGRYRTPAWFTVTGELEGTYDVWVWVNGSTYDPVLPAGSIVIY